MEIHATASPLHAVAKMLGHGNATTTAKSHLPFVKELEAATIAAGAAALKHATPKGKGRVVILTKR